jgi:Flp pilus assembly protein TadG
MTGTRTRDERGTALVEAVWLVLLLLVPLVYVVLAVFDVQRASYGVSAAARAAARAYTLAPDEATAATRARAAAAVALRDQDIDPSQVGLAVRCSPDPDNCLVPGGVVSVDVSHQVRLPLAPSALGGSAPSFRLETSHTVGYGTYREDR